jgi:hypothetical protein
MVVLGVAWLLRLYLWTFGADWKELATYTSLAYCGPFTLFMLWLIYRGSRWGRAILALLYAIHLEHWLRAMRALDYSIYDIVFMSGELALQAAGLLLIFLPSSNVWFRAATTSATRSISVDVE